MNDINLALTLRKRLVFFVCILLVCFFIVTVLSGLIMKIASTATPAVRIVTVVQDVVLFIIPPVVTALLVTRRPASLLCIDRLPKTRVAVMAVIALFAASPAMNLVIYLNQHVPLPEGVASALHDMEQAAEQTVQVMMGAHDLPNLLVSVLIVGVLAGVSEELLFRGGLQRLLSTGGVNPHTAIWVTAVVFSLLHMQFYGFVPRMLLGAFFGYALYWSGSLWLPIILHVLNNASYTIVEYMDYGSDTQSWLSTVGSGGDFAVVAVSVVLTTVLLWLMHDASASHRLVDHAHDGGAHGSL